MPPQVIGTGRSIDSEFNSRENLPRPRHWHRSCCKTTKKKPLPVFKFSHPRAVWKLFCPLYVSRCGKIQVALLLNNAKSDKEVCKKKLQASPVLNTALHKLFPQLVLCCSVVPSHGELGAILGLLRRQGVLTVHCKRVNIVY